MNLPVVRSLVEKHSVAVITQAAATFEKNRENPLGVTGKDDAEILSNLLVAEFVGGLVEKGSTFQDAVRQYSQRVRAMITPKK